MRLWPEVAWYGLTRPRLLLVIRLFVWLVLIAMLLSLGAVAWFRYERQKGEQLLTEVHLLNIGESNRQDVLTMGERFGGAHYFTQPPCTPAECLLAIQVSSPLFRHLAAAEGRWAYEVARYLDNDILNGLGIREWHVRCAIQLKNDRLKEYSCTVLVEGLLHDHGWLDAGWRVGSKVPESMLRLYSAAYGNANPQLVVEWHHLNMGLEHGAGYAAILGSSPSQKERDIAFGINMECLTKVSGCISLGELAPGMAQHVRERNARLDALPDDP